MLVVAGRSPAFPACSCRWARTHVHTRGAGNHAVPLSALPQPGPVRPDDSGAANNGWDWLPRLPIPYADRASSSSIAQGLTAATATSTGAARRFFALEQNRLAERGRREVYEATQDHPLRR